MTSFPGSLVVLNGGVAHMWHATQSTMMTSRD